MLDFGWTELLLIAIVAVVVIGPKDLPKAMAGLADWIRKLRGMASDFQGQVDDMVKGTELEDVKKAAQGLNRYNVKRQLTNAIDPKGQMKKALDETRQAVNARVDVPAPTLASSADMVEATTDVAVPGAEPGPAMIANQPAVRAIGGDPVPVAPVPQPKAKPRPKSSLKPAPTGAAKANGTANSNGPAAPAVKPARARKKAAAGETGRAPQPD